MRRVRERPDVEYAKNWIPRGGKTKYVSAGGRTVIPWLLPAADRYDAACARRHETIVRARLTEVFSGQHLQHAKEFVQKSP